jgi:hypothetical protein
VKYGLPDDAVKKIRAVLVHYNIGDPDVIAHIGHVGLVFYAQNKGLLEPP